MCHAFIDKYGIFPQAEDVADEIVQMMKEIFLKNNLQAFSGMPVCFWT